MKLPLFRAARLCCVLAALALCATDAAAQRRGDAIPASELRRSQATRLYETVAELRPEWLFLGGDTAQAASRERVVVFVNGRHVGDLGALWTIQTADVASVRLRSPEYVRRTDPRFPRTEFNAAIYVATRAAPESLPQGRLTLSVEASFNLVTQASAADDALTDAGYDQDHLEVNQGVVQFQHPGTETPFSVGGTVAYAVAQPWGVALTGLYTFEGTATGYSPDANFAASTSFTSTEGALLATRDVGQVRLGAGPAFRTVNWTWASGMCQCENEQESTSSAFGLAAEGAALLRLPGIPVLPQVRVLARWYPSQETEYSALGEPLEVGGVVVSMGVGLATRF